MQKLGLEVDTLQEALDKETSISSEIGEVLDLMNQFRSGQKGRSPTKQEWDDLLNQLDELRKQQLENYKELERLSNGAIRYRKGKGLILKARS